MTLTSERPWRKAKRLFEDHFKGETFAETLIKNLDGGVIYSDNSRFVLAQEAETDGSSIDFDGPNKNAWYVQLAVSSSVNGPADIISALPKGNKAFICYHRGLRSDDLKCYVWERFSRKVGL
jgi:hypothetical protein